MDAVKVGMLGTVEVTLAVARALDELPPGTPVVVDPVMVAESGARLLDEDAQEALIAEILPRASVLTPNVPEARVLADGAGHRRNGRGGEGGGGGDGRGERERITRRRRGTQGSGMGRTMRRESWRGRCSRSVRTSVVLTGGHRARAVDLLLGFERRRADDRDLRRAISRRRGARLRMHALRRARGATRAGRYAAAGGSDRAQARGRGGRRGAARRGLRRRSGRRAGAAGAARGLRSSGLAVP